MKRSGKGKISAEELRGQLGDAPGFGEMQGIFAEAYQMSLGRSPGEALKGQKAIEALNKAMENGEAISSKILPHVAEIAKRMAEPGLAEARLASFAEQNRFSNQMSEGWKLFREGGAEEGIAHFWRMMQGFGQWWVDNGTQIGMYFKSTILYLDAFQESIQELFKFAMTGEATSITDMFKRNGLDVDGIRSSLVTLKTSVMNLLGLNEGGDGLPGLSKRIIQFASDLAKIVDALSMVLRGVDKLLFSITPVRSREQEADVLRKDPANVLKNERTFALDRVKAGSENSRASGIRDIITGAGVGTWEAGSALKGLFFGSSPEGTFKPPFQYNPISLPSPQGSIPTMGPVDPSMMGAGSTRASQFVTHKVDVNLKVEGNAETIGLLIDSKVRDGFPLMLSNEIAKSITGAPIR